ncbi:hypothetical protein ACRAWG_26250 [Methylobacterium sp. P31]
MNNPHPESSSLKAGTTPWSGSFVGGRLQKFGRALLMELKHILGIFTYLWVIFGILILHEHAVLSRYGIAYKFYGLAFINAWILAKIMLVAEHLDARPHLQGKPLIYPIIARSCTFASLLVCAYALEEMAIGLWRGKTWVDSMPTIGGGGVFGFVSVIFIMAVALLPYFAFRELGRVLGPERLRALLFRDGSRPDVPGPGDSGKG